MMDDIRLTKSGVEVRAYGEEHNKLDLERFCSSLRYDGLIPVNLRWADPISGIYVLEYPPTERLIDVVDNPLKRGYVEEGMRRIPVPWQIYIYNHRLKSVQFFCRTEQLRSLEDDLLHQYLPNVYRSGTPCGGVKGEYIVDDPLRSAANYIDGLWMTTFNGGNYISSSPHGGFGKGELFAVEGSLMPREMIDAGFDDFWAKKDVFAWLEERSIEEILGWEWQDAGTLDAHISEQEVQGWAGLRQIVNRLRKEEEKEEEE